MATRSPPRSPSHQLFTELAQRTARVVGSGWAFVIALGVIVVWAVLGPIYHFSDTWQLVVNTGTTIVTFLIVFLIQGSQNRETRAIRLKLDELIRAHRGARNRLIELEEMSDDELDELQKQFERLRDQRDEQPHHH
jgi:low affinity Fe/Cu permease